MPKRLLIFLALVSLAIAACHSGSTTPSASSTPYSPSPNPSITKATVEVTIHGTPQPNIPVNESTPANPGSPRPGKTFETLYTGKKGKAVFKDLKPSKTYCWVAIVETSQAYSECAGWAVWQSGIILLGT